MNRNYCLSTTITLVLLLLSSTTLHSNETDIPSWAREGGQQRIGQVYRVACSGIGPDASIARREAIESCQSSAGQQLLTNIRVKSLSVETEKEVAFHQEISDEAQFSNLRCNPLKEKINDTDQQVKLWLLCEFDLSKAKAIPLNSKNDPTEAKTTNNGIIKNKDDLERVTAKYGRGKTGRYLSGQQKTITISVVPQCTDLLIRGEEPSRTIACHENPVTVVVDQADTEIIVRASGYMPKTLSLSKRKEVEDYAEVILVPKD